MATAHQPPPLRPPYGPGKPPARRIDLAASSTCRRPPSPTGSKCSPVSSGSEPPGQPGPHPDRISAQPPLTAAPPFGVPGGGKRSGAGVATAAEVRPSPSPPAGDLLQGAGASAGAAQGAAPSAGSPREERPPLGSTLVLRIPVAPFFDTFADSLQPSPSPAFTAARSPACSPPRRISPDSRGRVWRGGDLVP